MKPLPGFITYGQYNYDLNRGAISSMLEKKLVLI